MNAKPVPTKVARTGCDEFKADTENLSTAGLQSNPLFPEPQLVRRINEILSRNQFLALAHHLHNGNGPHDFVMAISSQDGSTGFSRAKRQTIHRALGSCWDSVTAEKEFPFSVALFPRNADAMSTWCGFDIDAHSPTGIPHAEWVLRKLSPVIRRWISSREAEEIALLIEGSGRGFHIFLIAAELRPVATWTKIMRLLLKDAELNAKTDNIELFPSGNGEGPGHALRVPGSANVRTWNPASGDYSCSMILAESGLKRLVDRLPQFDETLLASGFDNKRDLPFIITSEEMRTAWTPAQPKALHEHVDATRILEQYAITTPSSRHLQLCSLVGDGIFHFSRNQLRRLAEFHYGQADPTPSTGLDHHLIEFEKAYEGLLAQFDARMSVEEEQMLRSLRNVRCREAFIIAQSFARHAIATRKWGQDSKFPLSGLDLATRLGVKTLSGYRIRKMLITAGCIRKVEECKPCREAEKYVWLLNMKQTTA